MEFISGISKKEYASIKELAQGSCDGKTVRMEGMHREAVMVRLFAWREWFMP